MYPPIPRTMMGEKRKRKTRVELDQLNSYRGILFCGRYPFYSKDTKNEPLLTATISWHDIVLLPKIDRQAPHRYIV